MMTRVTEKLARVWFGLRHANRFKSFGAKSHVAGPFRVDGVTRISIGSATFVQGGGWLYCVGIDGADASLSIGDGCVLGYNNHVTAVRNVRIGDHVLTANNVYISDNVHDYQDTTVPIMDQPVVFRQPVTIGSGSWIGENACIIGANVGRNCVVGANAVVTRDVPDFCVVVGIPARIIRRFDAPSQTWISVERP